MLRCSDLIDGGFISQSNGTLTLAFTSFLFHCFIIPVLTYFLSSICVLKIEFIVSSLFVF